MREKCEHVLIANDNYIVNTSGMKGPQSAQPSNEIMCLGEVCIISTVCTELDILAVKTTRMRIWCPLVLVPSLPALGNAEKTK